MSNINISKTTKNDSKSNISELTDSDLAGIQGGKKVLIFTSIDALNRLFGFIH